jgi:DNA-binding response OmpR family regulator
LNENKIILVEDDIDFTRILKTCFTWLGFNVADSINPLLALDYYRCKGDLYSLIILDWKMPLMNGLILTTNIRQISKIAKILVITACDISSIKTLPEYDDLKFDQILQKPIRMSSLRGIVCNLLTE